MIKVTQIKLNIHHTDRELEEKLSKKLGIKLSELGEYYIVKRSLDARDKNDIRYSYSIQVRLSDRDEKRILARADRIKDHDIVKDDFCPYRLPANGKEKLKTRPVIIGFGPAGIFAALSLARAGLRPLILEKGQNAQDRKKTVEMFWNGGALDPGSNVSFGEGGAGTFSDGKLNTLVKDSYGRNTEVLRTLADFGADSSIMYVHNPHIGTDRLIGIVTAIRQEIIRLGGEIRFGAEVTDFNVEGGRLQSIEVNRKDIIETEAVVLAIGHSSRDTFYKLREKSIAMQSKAFAVGLRIQHPQSMIDEVRYGEAAEFLGPASYKLSESVSNGRGVYSFCMCPGGYVADASSEDLMKCVNGMSYHARASANANSAVIVTVTPDDFDGGDALAGIEFQRRLERAAYVYGDGNIPVQLLGDYLEGRYSTGYGDVGPVFKGSTAFSRLDECLPEYIHRSISEAMPQFEKRIKGFSRPDAILAGVESRTSSPVRILRNDDLISNVGGLYPCGEGAGYAGGITSAAMDGLKVAEKIIEKYSAF